MLQHKAARSVRKETNIHTTTMPVKLLNWNARSVRAHREELKQRVFVENYDIVCIQESFLKPSDNFEIPGYSSIRSDRKTLTCGGGLVSFVRNGLKYCKLDSPMHIEAQIFSVRTACGVINIVNVYLPPVSPLNVEQLVAFKGLLRLDKALVVGDFNAKSALWCSPITNRRGRELSDLITESEYVVLNTGKPTHVHHDGGVSHIDVGLASRGLAMKCQWTVLDDCMGSDHYPILITLDERPVIEKSSTPRWKLKNADWSAFETACLVAFTDPPIDSDVEQLNEFITSSIVKAAEATVHQTSPGLAKRNKPLPYWNDDIKVAIQARNRAERKMKRTKNLDDCIEYRRLKSIAQRTIRSTSKAHWRDFCSTLTNHTRLSTVWNMAKRMSGVRCNPSSVTLKNSTGIANTNTDKAEIFARSFAEISSSANYSPAFREHMKDVEDNHGHLFANDAADNEWSHELNAEFSLHELKLALSQSRCRKAPGEDRVTNEFLKFLPFSGKKTILALFNTVWKSGEVPRGWRHAIVTPILKAGKDPQLASSFRPISLTSALCKLMEKLVVNRLQWYLERFKLLNGVQSGFRKNRSTCDQLVRLQDTVVRQVNNHGFVLCVFLDMEKAFDMVWRKGLMIKLKKIGINGRMFAWIEAFMSDRTIQVRVGPILSDVYKLENGTAQGSTISPTVFLKMIDDLPDCTKEVDTSLFADDSMLSKAGRSLPSLVSSMQKALDAVHTWCESWGFKISVDKTVAVVFTKRIQMAPFSLTIAGNAIKIEKSAKFLGLVWDGRLTWRQHIDLISIKCQKRLNLMRSVSGTKWGADAKSLKAIYVMLIQSVIDYGSIVYDSASEWQLERLEKIQNQAMKLICGSMKGTSIAALQVESGLMPLSLRRHSQQIRFAVKVTSTGDHVARQVFKDHWTTHYGQYTDRTCPMAVKVHEFLETLDDVIVRSPTWLRFPPWKVRLPDTDTSLTKQVSKHDAPDILAALARELIASLDDRIHIFTDASRSTDGKVGIGLFVRSPKGGGWPDFEHSARLSDNVSVYAGELSAIRLALECAKQIFDRTGRNRFAIFSDSLSSVQSIERGQSLARPNLFNQIIDALHKSEIDTIVVWVPSHVGIFGNEKADRQALIGSEREAVDLEIGLELEDAYHMVDKYVATEWQTSWETAPHGSFYRQIEPTVRRRSRPLVFRSRATETLAHRLRLGRCRLNAYLFQMKCHPTGLCESCHQPETVAHYLLECTGAVATAVKRKCASLGVAFNITDVLRNTQIIETIAKANVRRL